LKAQTAEDLSFLPDKSVDAIITDPPYYGNVMYSELADFFYIWQKLALNDKYKYYEGTYSPRSREIIKSAVQGKDDSFFIKGLTNVFRECYKDEGLLTFTFHHERSSAWASTLLSLLNSNFEIVATYPIYSETKGEYLHSKGIRYDIVIVCKKRFKEPERVSWEVLKDRIHDMAREVLERLWLSDRDLRDEDMFVIAMGKCLELYSKHCPEIYKDGRRVTVEEAVSSIDDIIDSLLKIKDIEALPGAIDKITRIYCSYLAGLDKIDYDALHKRLSKGGIEIDAFLKENLITKEKSTVRILTPQERRQFIEEKIKKGKDLLVIDKVHLIYSIYKEGKSIIKYLAEYGGEVEKTAELIYRKTGDEAYGKIAGIATRIPKKVKLLTLEDFIGESQ